MAPMDVCCRHCCWYADIYRNVCLPVKTTEICKQESKHFILQRTRFFAIYMYSIGMPNCGPQLNLQRSSFVNQIKLVIVLVLFVYITIFTLSEVALVVVYRHQKKHWQFLQIPHAAARQLKRRNTQIVTLCYCHLSGRSQTLETWILKIPLRL